MDPKLIFIPTGYAGYHEVMREVVARGKRNPRSPRGIPTFDAGHVTIVLDQPHDALPTGQGRDVSPEIAAAEAIQLIGGFTAPHLLPLSFDRFKEPDGRFHGAYGYRIGDQLSHVIRKLTDDSETRQAIISLWDRVADNQPGKKDYPCTVALRFSIQHKFKLELDVIMRSNDAWLGMPYDWFQFAQLQLTVANLMGLTVGPYRHTAWSLHLYQSDLPKVEEMLQFTARSKSVRQLPMGLGTAYDTVDTMQVRAEHIAFDKPCSPATRTEAWYREVLMDRRVA